MNVTRFPGGFYIDALPSGAYCVLFPNSHIQTHQGTIAFPPGESYGPMFLHCSEVGGFHFAGLAHEKVGTMREWWEGKGWGEQPAVFGRFVYGRQGEILDVLPAGYQYLREDTGEPIPRTYTYGPRNGLSEWLVVGDLQIGQGHDSIAPAGQGGVLLWDGKVHRMLESGQCTFINAHRDGEKVAISFCKPDGAVIVQTTLSELRALPVYTPITAKPPAPVPVPQPPTSEPKPVNVPDYSQFVRDFIGPRLRRLASQDETRAHSFEALNACCMEVHRKDPRFGLLEKTGGGRVKDRASDVLAYDLGNGTAQLLDVISDSEGEDGTPRAGWGLIPADKAGIRPIAQWKLPYLVVVAPPTPPLLTPDPIPLDPGPSDIAASLAVIVLGLGDLRAKLETLDAQLTVTQRVVVDLAARKPPSYRGKLALNMTLDPQA